MGTFIRGHKAADPAHRTGPALDSTRFDVKVSGEDRPTAPQPCQALLRHT